MMNGVKNIILQINGRLLNLNMGGINTLSVLDIVKKSNIDSYNNNNPNNNSNDYLWVFIVILIVVYLIVEYLSINSK